MPRWCSPRCWWPAATTTATARAADCSRPPRTKASWPRPTARRPRFRSPLPRPSTSGYLCLGERDGVVIGATGQIEDGSRHHPADRLTRRERAGDVGRRCDADRYALGRRDHREVTGAGLTGGFAALSSTIDDRRVPTAARSRAPRSTSIPQPGGRHVHLVAAGSVVQGSSVGVDASSRSPARPRAPVAS